MFKKLACYSLITLIISASAVQSSRFSDVGQAHWAYKAVSSMVSAGIMEAGGGRFRPDDPATRAECAMAVTVLLDRVDEIAESGFSDVSRYDKYYKYVSSAYEYGIMLGDGFEFKPRNAVMRQELFTLVSRALAMYYEIPDKDEYISECLNFSDNDKIAGYARAGIAKLVKYGLVTGRPGNMVEPEASATRAELAALMARIYDPRLHGINFSPYIGEQNPDYSSQISEEQAKERLNTVKPGVEWIRTFSCSDGNENICRIAREMGLKTLAGAWIGKDRTGNDRGISNVIAAAKSGFADIVAVGNEALLRGDVTEEELAEYILRVKKEAPDIPVSTADSYGAILGSPKVMDACDVLLVNCYPFWEGKKSRTRSQPWKICTTVS